MSARMAPSNIAPQIKIVYRDVENYKDAERALIKLNSKPYGKGLLDKIKDVSVDDKRVCVVVGNDYTNRCHPILTQSQMDRLNIKNPLERESLDKAAEMAHIKADKTRGEGSSSHVYWNPLHSTEISATGFPSRGFDKEKNFVSLAHELIHGLHMMSGEWVGGHMENLANPNSLEAKEEFRTVGIGKFNHNPVSENAIRYEHNFPLRASYYQSG
ncbi:hypothetical protein C1Y41_04100 [Pantoea sp. ICBG 1758]|uniref:XopG/HopH/AvrPtoH family type III secretion system effector n=1 Tax=Pantoea sp. ICBG 1758 TaxID=2071682 RepID=UPI000CE4E5A1|nr:XopG/HopH/AvrPtoH family type III secretion system effector [Pantoea sp. ICBG 1758]PPC63833.1 hypothetical protein C1Y41_04100 [Pantoea sp. ICBG 1758]